MADACPTIREARWTDCGAMARKICQGRWLAYHHAGIDVRAKLRELWGASIVRRTWLVDGRIAAMGGLTGSVLSRSGHVWLAVAPEAERQRFALVREAMRQCEEVARTKRELRTTVAEQDGTGMRFAKWMGFVEDVDEDGHPLRMQIGESGIFVIPMTLRR